jgi:hypothetical protein
MTESGLAARTVATAQGLRPTGSVVGAQADNLVLPMADVRLSKQSSLIVIWRTLAAPALMSREVPATVFTHVVACIALSITARKLRVTLNGKVDSSSRHTCH